MLVLVTRPEATALTEAERTRGELAALGVANQQLIVNGSLRRDESRRPGGTRPRRARTGGALCHPERPRKARSKSRVPLLFA